MKTSEMVFHYLKKQGFCPEFDRDNDIVFKYETLTFLYFNNDDDEQFFRLALPGIYDVTEENRFAVLEAINETNRIMKVVKLTIPRDDVWVLAEIMMDSNPELDDLVPRLLNILTGARQEFYDQLG